MITVQTTSDGQTCFTIENLDDVKTFGRLLAAAVCPGMCLLLEGELGAGKTTLIRELCRALGWKRTCSPSFSLVNEYARARIPVAHADLYRIDSADPRDFGLDEYIDDGWLLIIEWPERLVNEDFQDVWRCRFTVETDGSRRLWVSASGTHAKNALSALEKSLK